MNELKRILKKIMDVFSRKSPEINGTLSNQELIDKVLEIYKKRFKQESTRQSMLFPTCFRIYLHTEDFTARQEAFATIARDMASEFNAFNRTEMLKYRYNKPPASDWLFQFIEFEEDTVIKNIDAINQGEVYTVSTLYSNKFSTNRDNIGNEGNITMTKQVKKSLNVQQANINLNAFLGMEMLEGNRFSFKINDNYEDEIIPRKEVCLICDKNFIGGQSRGNKYYITANYIEISGKNDTRSGAQYVKIDYNLPNSIVHIKYDNGRYLFAAFGKVRLNQMLIKESKGAPEWTELSDNSKMLVCDEVSIEFKRN